MTEPVATHPTQKSPIPGVQRSTWGNTWFVQFRHQGRKVYLGSFAEMADAEQCAIDARVAMGQVSILDEVAELRSRGITVGRNEGVTQHEEIQLVED